ncbi:MAG: hypothetical protein AAGK74_06825, partial [Chloroflexota bacterium]
STSAGGSCAAWPRPYRRYVFFGALAVLLVIALWLRGITVAIMPTDWDENYYLNIASNWIERGGLTPYMWRLDPDTNIIAGSGTGYGVIVLNVWFQATALTFTSGRVFMFAATLANVAVLAMVARAWWGTWQAAAVTAIIAASLTSSFQSVYVRMDAPGVLAYSLVLWLHIVAVQREKWWLHALVGVAAIATTQFHILGLLYVGALAFYYAVEALIRLWQQRSARAIVPAAAFGVGALVAGVIYVVHHILPDPEAYFLIPNSCFYCEPASFSKEIERYSRYWRGRTVEVMVGGLAIAFAALRFRQPDRHYLLLLAGFVLALGVVSPPTQLRYSLHGWPWIALGAGGVFSVDLRGWQQWAYRVPVREALVLASVGALLFVQWGRFDGYRSRGDPYKLKETRAYVRSLDLPRETVILTLTPFYEDFLAYPNFLS